MQATFYKTTDDVKTVSKTLTQTDTATLRPTHNMDVLRPVFVVDKDGLDLTSNYVYIAEYQRYYFAKLSVSPAKKIIVECTVDALMTYAAGIRSCTACVIRSESIGKPTDVIDVSLPIHQSQVTTTAIDLGNPIFTTNPSHGYFLTLQGTNGT